MKKILSFGVLMAVTLMAAQARAQVNAGISLAPATGQASTVNQADCQDGKSVNFTYSITNFTANTKIAIWVTTGTCGDTPGANDHSVTDKITVTSATTNGSESFLITDVIADCPPNTKTDMTICGKSYNQNTSGSDVISNSATLVVTYSSKRPRKPTITSEASGDRTIHLGWKAGDDIAKWKIFYATTGEAPSDADQDPCTPPVDGGVTETDGGAEDAGEVDSGIPEVVDGGPTEDGGTADAGGSDAGTEIDNNVDVSKAAGWSSKEIDEGSVTSTDLTGLTNGQTYRIRMTAVDSAGNESLQSDEVTATPRLVQDFFRRYRCAGGTEKGGFGCSASGAAATLIPVAGLAIAALLRRRAARRPE